jgi:hypothetical protein
MDVYVTDALEQEILLVRTTRLFSFFANNKLSNEWLDDAAESIASDLKALCRTVEEKDDPVGGQWRRRRHAGRI